MGENGWDTAENGWRGKVTEFSGHGGSNGPGEGERMRPVRALGHSGGGLRAFALRGVNLHNVPLYMH